MSRAFYWKKRLYKTFPAALKPGATTEKTNEQNDTNSDGHEQNKNDHGRGAPQGSGDPRGDRSPGELAP